VKRTRGPQYFDWKHRKKAARAAEIRNGASKKPTGHPRHDEPSSEALKKREQRERRQDRINLENLLQTPGVAEIIRRGQGLRGTEYLASENPVVKGFTQALINNSKYDNGPLSGEKRKQIQSQSTRDGRACKSTIVGIVAQSVPASHFSEMVQGAVTSRYVRRQKRKVNEEGFLQLMHMKCPDVARVSVPAEEQKLYLDFFEKHTVVFSGARLPTKHLLIPLHELEIILYAEFPGMLRAGLKDRPPEGHNSFTRAIRAAWDAKEQPGFDANLEWESRYKEKKDKYKQLLVDKMAENQVQMVIKCATCGEDSDKPPIFPCPTLHADQEAGDDDKPPIVAGVSLSLQPPIVPGRRDGYEDTDSGKTDLPKKIHVNVDGGDSVKLPIFACANLLADQKPGDENNHSKEADLPQKNPIRPRGMPVFWKILREAGVLWTQSAHPHPCHLHENGPAQVQLLETLLAQHTETVRRQAIYEQDSEEWDKCRRELNALNQRICDTKKLVRNYNLHLEQFEKCRAYAKDIEENLKPGECLVFRDFVNQYGGEGDKVANLVLVRVSRDELGQPIVVKVSHPCTDEDSNSTDAYYVADVFAYHMSTADPGLFESFHTIYVVGDHGSHFSCNDTLRNEASFYKKYKKELRPIFLCSYHAYNRCDAAGVEFMRALHAFIKNGGKEQSGTKVAAVMNDSNYSNHKAVPFEKICRNIDTFPPYTKKLPEIRKVCEIQYFFEHQGEICHEDDIALYRLVPGTGPFTVHDFNSRSERKLCQTCSDLHQRPIRHNRKDCPRKPKVPMDTRGPRDDRFQPWQYNQKHKNQLGKAVPCKVPHCLSTFDSGKNANAHMRKSHKDQIASIEFYPPAEKKKKNKKKQKKKKK
jgi:hypothetical protein